MENQENKPENAQEQLPITETPLEAKPAESQLPERAENEDASAEILDDKGREAAAKPEEAVAETTAPEPEKLEEVSGGLPAERPSTKRSIITTVIVLVVIVLVFWYVSKENSKETVPANNEAENANISVNSNMENGEVKIIGEGNNNQEIKQPEETATTGQGEESYKIVAYYSNTKNDPGAQDCSRVYALERPGEKKYDSEVVNAVRGLLAPLTEAEQADGWVSNIPAGAALSYVKVENGMAIANFNSALGQVGGSCAVAAIRAQIERTLTQFSYIKAVTICVNGNCNQEEILQP
ncbi:MAG: GerMN domain-containing protein [Patescibacteria group bacterium]